MHNEHERCSENVGFICLRATVLLQTSRGVTVFERIFGEPIFYSKFNGIKPSPKMLCQLRVLYISLEIGSKYYYKAFRRYPG